jgi:hypothetical protein
MKKGLPSVSVVSTSRKSARTGRSVQGKDRSDHSVDLGGGEAVEAELGGEPVAIELGQHARQPGTDLVVAVGEHHHHRRLGAAAGKGEQHLQTGVIAPMQVLDDDEARTGGRRSDQDLDQRADQLPPLLLRFQSGGCRRCRQRQAEFRQQPNEQWRRGAELLLNLLGRPPRQRWLEQVDQRGIGERLVGLEASPLKDGKAAPLGAEARLGDQS